MGNIKQAYAASSAVTITLASLATSSTLLVGRESTVIDNSTNLYLDYLIAGQVMTGTTPTAGTIEVHVVTMIDDTVWPDIFDGLDSAETITSSDIKNSICKPVATMVTSTTSNQGYPFGQVSVAGICGGTCPRKFIVFVSQNTGVNLNATGSNHFITITPCYATSI